MESGVGNFLIRFFDGLQCYGVRSGLQITPGKVERNVRAGVSGIEDVYQVATAVIELRVKIKNALLAVDIDLQSRHAGILNQQCDMEPVGFSRRTIQRECNRARSVLDTGFLRLAGRTQQGPLRAKPILCGIALRDDEIYLLLRVPPCELAGGAIELSDLEYRFFRVILRRGHG